MIEFIIISRKYSYIIPCKQNLDLSNIVVQEEHRTINDLNITLDESECSNFDNGDGEAQINIYFVVSINNNID